MAHPGTTAALAHYFVETGKKAPWVARQDLPPGRSGNTDMIQALNGNFVPLTTIDFCWCLDGCLHLGCEGWKWKDVPLTLGTIVCRFTAQSPLMRCLPWFDSAEPRTWSPTLGITVQYRAQVDLDGEGLSRAWGVGRGIHLESNN